MYLPCFGLFFLMFGLLSVWPFPRVASSGLESPLQVPGYTSILQGFSSCGMDSCSAPCQERQASLHNFWARFAEPCVGPPFPAPFNCHSVWGPLGFTRSACGRVGRVNLSRSIRPRLRSLCQGTYEEFAQLVCFAIFKV